MIGRCVIAVDLLNNDDLFVTSNWWGQSWGRTCEPVRLTKLGTCLTYPTSLPYTRTGMVAGQRLVGYTTPLPGCLPACPSTLHSHTGSRYAGTFRPTIPFCMFAGLTGGGVGVECRPREGGTTRIAGR